MNLLDISINASYVIGEDAPAWQATVTAIFFIQTRISQPRLVKELAFKLFPDEAYSESSIPTCFIQRFDSSDEASRSAKFERQDLQECLPLIKFQLPVSKASIQHHHKLPRNCNIDIRIRLEDFMTWGKEAQPFLSQDKSGNTCVLLKWLDVELNPDMTWSLPIGRKAQEPGASVTSKSTQEGKALAMSLEPPSDQHRLQGTTTPEKKSRNIFKKT
ncbi:MAG: hypothetical protein Q9170_007221 [Blastenia crenularia]